MFASVIVSARYRILLDILKGNHFLLLDLLKYVVDTIGMLLMYLLKIFQRQWQCSRCHHKESQPLFLHFLKFNNNIILVTVSYDRAYASIICSIFPLCMDSNAVEIFFEYFLDDSTDSQSIWRCWSISLKVVLIFPRNFLDSRSVTIEMKGIINLSSYSSNSNAYVVIKDSEVFFFVFFLGKGRCSCSFIYRLLFFIYTQCYIIENVYRQFFLFSILQQVFLYGLRFFCLL